VRARPALSFRCSIDMCGLSDTSMAMKRSFYMIISVERCLPMVGSHFIAFQG
jgi:hypothetical protein